MINLNLLFLHGCSEFIQQFQRINFVLTSYIYKYNLKHCQSFGQAMHVPRFIILDVLKLILLSQKSL